MYTSLSSWDPRQYPNQKEVSLFQGCPYRGIPLYAHVVFGVAIASVGKMDARGKGLCRANRIGIKH